MSIWVDGYMRKNFLDTDSRCTSGQVSLIFTDNIVILVDMIDPDVNPGLKSKIYRIINFYSVNSVSSVAAKMDENLVMTDASTSEDYYYLHDHLHSPVAVVDIDGEVIERYEYDAYGKPTYWEGDYEMELEATGIGNPYYFTGRRIDFVGVSVFMIQYNRGRFYDYKTGRWLNQDPIGYQDGVNLYAYVNSNPINRADPQGLTPQDPGAGYDDNSWMDNPLSFPTPCQLGYGADCGGEPNPDVPQWEGDTDCELNDSSDDKRYDENWEEKQKNCIEDCDELPLNWRSKCKRGCYSFYRPPWEITNPDKNMERFYWAKWDKEKKCIYELSFRGHGLYGEGDLDDPESIPDKMERWDNTQIPLVALDFPSKNRLCCKVTIYLKSCGIGKNLDFMRNLVDNGYARKFYSGTKFIIKGCRGTYYAYIDICIGGWETVEIQL